MAGLNFLIVIFTFVLVGCGQSDEGKSALQPETVPFHGAYISKNYYISLLKTKSPRAAQSNSRFIFIPENEGEEAFMAYNFHEGNSFIVVKEDSGYKLGFPSNSNSDRPICNENNLCEDIKINSEMEISVDGIDFIKVNYPKGYGRSDLAVADILFKGIYRLPDGSSVAFKGDGTLTGLDDFNYYEIQLDYYDVALDVDLMILGSTSSDLDVSLLDHEKWFGFKFSDNGLYFYKIKCTEKDGDECVAIGFSELRYQLERVN